MTPGAQAPGAQGRPGRHGGLSHLRVAVVMLRSSNEGRRGKEIGKLEKEGLSNNFGVQLLVLGTGRSKQTEPRCKENEQLRHKHAAVSPVSQEQKAGGKVSSTLQATLPAASAAAELTGQEPSAGGGQETWGAMHTLSPDDGRTDCQEGRVPALACQPCFHQLPGRQQLPSRAPSPGGPQERLKTAVFTSKHRI